MNSIDIPDSTESLHNLGSFIMSYQPYQNAFLSALVNRIGRVMVTSKMWNNPWAVFKRGTLDMGETVEEIFVNIAKPQSFDPGKAESTFMKREIPDVRAAFHTMNFQKFYKVTVSNDQLRQAFLSWQGITDLIAKIVDSLYTGMQLDEYLTMKYMMAREILNGGMYPVTVDNLESNPKDAVRNFREYTNNLTFLKATYNRAGVRTSTAIEDQIIIVPNYAESLIGVEVLADAFHLGEVDYLGKRIAIDSFEFDSSDTDRLDELFADDPYYEPLTGEEIIHLQQLAAVKVDRGWWMVFDNYQQFTENYNGQGLYWQYFYHAWKTFSVSPFANAIAFTMESSEIEEVLVSPSAANVSQGSSMQFTATVTGRGLIKKTVVWSIEGGTKSGTTINAENGTVHVAADEPVGTEITVTATAVDGQTGTASVYVTTRSQGSITKVTTTPSETSIKVSDKGYVTVAVTGTGRFSDEVTATLEPTEGAVLAEGTEIGVLSSTQVSVHIGGAQSVGDKLILTVVSVQDPTKKSSTTVTVIA